MARKIPAPAPVTIMRPDADGTMQVAAVIAAPPVTRIASGFEPEVVRRPCLCRVVVIGEDGSRKTMIDDVPQTRAENWVVKNLLKYNEGQRVVIESML